ncbi:MAG: hypothetical protein ABL916_11400 [Burkholderiaceae bacterium]
MQRSAQLDSRVAPLRPSTDHLRIDVNADAVQCPPLVAHHRAAAQVRLDVDTMRRYQVDDVLEGLALATGIARRCESSSDLTMNSSTPMRETLSALVLT